MKTHESRSEIKARARIKDRNNELRADILHYRDRSSDGLIFVGSSSTLRQMIWDEVKQGNKRLPFVLSGDLMIEMNDN